MTAPDLFMLGGREDDPIPAMVDEWFRAWDLVESNDDFDQAEAITDPIQAVLLDAVPTSLSGIAAQLRFLHHFAADAGDLYTDGRLTRIIDAMTAGVERMERAR
jgi:hypothetical protein